MANRMKKSIFVAKLQFDTSKPDATPRKLLDVNKLSSLGGQSRMGLEDGSAKTYQWFCEHYESIRN